MIMSQKIYQKEMKHFVVNMKDFGLDLCWLPNWNLSSFITWRPYPIPKVVGRVKM